MTTKSEQFNPPEQKIKAENITVLDENSEEVQRFPESRKKLGWPVEMRAGWGITDSKSGEIKIAYVRGDKFISLAIIIHELGHPRQDEINPDINAMDKDKQHDEYVIAKERDAQTRGWERVLKYFPDLLKQLEADFENCLQSGVISGYSNFREFYDKMNDVSVLINQTINEAPESEDDEEQEELIFKALEEVGLSEHFTELERVRTGELVDAKKMEELMRKIRF